MKKHYLKLAAVLAILPIWNTSAVAQGSKLEDIRVHAVSLERNLLGDSADKRLPCVPAAEL